MILQFYQKAGFSVGVEGGGFGAGRIESHFALKTNFDLVLQYPLK
jgi:hypothetical protein